MLTDSDEPGRGGPRAKPHGLVRPYVLSADNSAQERQVRSDDREHLTRDDRPPLDWTGDPRQRRVRDPRSEPTRRDAPKAATAPPPEVKSAGSHRASPRGQPNALRLGWAGLLADRRRPVIIGAGAAALAIIGGMILFLPRSPSKVLADAPPSAHKPVRRSNPIASRSTAHHSPGSNRTHPTPSPTRASRSPRSPKPTPRATPTSTPSASLTQQPAEVKVTYTVVRQHPHTFEGKFTIVNNGSSAINGWELVVVLPGVDVRSVSNGSFHTSGDTVFIDPAQSLRSIASGATITENFTAHGSTTMLTSCTFNGSAC